MPIFQDARCSMRVYQCDRIGDAARNVRQVRVGEDAVDSKQRPHFSFVVYYYCYARLVASETRFRQAKPEV